MHKMLAFALAVAVSGCQSARTQSSDVVAPKLTAEISEKQSDASDTDPVTTASVKKPSNANTANAVQNYVAPKKGTVFTWRNNWANLPDLISYRVAGTINVGETEYLKFTSVKGFKNETHAYYDARRFSLKGYRDRSDRAIVTFKPPEQRYKFPMSPGDKWVTSWKSIDHKTDRVTSGGGVVKVLRWETLKLPAGEFRALKVRMPVQRNAPRGLTHHAWFSPELGITIKEEIGGGSLNWSQVLEKVELPG